MNDWQPIETAPIGKMVWLWHRSWRHAFPGQRNGEDGECYIDTCEALARGWQGHATHWMPIPAPPSPDKTPGRLHRHEPESVYQDGASSDDADARPDLQQSEQYQREFEKWLDENSFSITKSSPGELK